MITEKKILIPIYGYILDIIIVDYWEELRNIIPDRIVEANASAVTISDGSSSTVVILSHSIDSIIHEAEHIKNFIWKYIGYRPQKDNDEVDAYLLAYIHKKIIEVYYKHNRLFSYYL